MKTDVLEVERIRTLQLLEGQFNRLSNPSITCQMLL